MEGWAMSQRILGEGREGTGRDRPVNAGGIRKGDRRIGRVPNFFATLPKADLVRCCICPWGFAVEPLTGPKARSRLRHTNRVEKKQRYLTYLSLSNASDPMLVRGKEGGGGVRHESWKAVRDIQVVCERYLTVRPALEIILQSKETDGHSTGRSFWCVGREVGVYCSDADMHVLYVYVYIPRPTGAHSAVKGW